MRANSKITSVFMGCLILGMAPTLANAAEGDKAQIFKRFLKTAKEEFHKVDQALQPDNADNTLDGNILPDGEVLFLTGRLPGNLKIQGIIFGQVRNQEIVLSFKDFTDVLKFPIDIDTEAGKAAGWYIRENKLFSLDLNAQTATSEKGTFNISDNVFIENDDIFIPVAELEQWFDFELDTRISSQELRVDPSQMLPIQEQFERRKQTIANNKIPDPKLPLRDTPPALIDMPVVDVIANTNLQQRGEESSFTRSLDGTLATRGDFAYGTLFTRSQFNNADGILSTRANYTQESTEENLLGPLKAQRFELGDVSGINLPLVNTPGQDLGLRISNTDPLSSLTNPTSALSGTAFPGWDVELYRDNQLIAIQTVDEEGFYNFTNVELFNQENNFELIFYGPLGEIRKESISIPVDRTALDRSKGLYDIAVTFEDEQAYLQDRSNRDQDSGSVNVTALYEQPLGNGQAILFGGRSNQVDGIRNYAFHTGYSGIIKQTLLNLNAAIDDEADINAELVARRNFGAHNFASATGWTDAGYDALTSPGDDDSGFLSQNFSVNGPLPFIDDQITRYSGNINYGQTGDGQKTLSSNLGVNTQIDRIRLNQQFNYLSGDALPDDQITSLTTVAGSYRKNDLRLVAVYDIAPERQLDSILANLQHRVSNRLRIRGEISREFERSLTAANISLDWQAGFARFTPLLEYNTDNDLFAGLSLRFSAYEDPVTGQVKTVDQNITNTGGLSVFVYLDENGNNRFDEGEKPLETVAVRAIQNGGIAQTNADGIALFTNMRSLRRTDVVLEEDSLEDPFWLFSGEGVSIIPRAGHIAKIEFPIHIGGEMDGTLYEIDEAGVSVPLKNAGINLYDEQGQLIKTAVTDAGGFYFFSKIPPGTYFLTIDERSAKRYSLALPKPQTIQIGYDGTLIFGRDIHVPFQKNYVPARIISDLNAYFDRHPHIERPEADTKISLNLGAYKTRILMGIKWYKIQKQFPQLKDLIHFYTAPMKSVKDPETGQHILRARFENGDLGQANEACTVMIDSGFECTVEILPGYFASLNQET